MNKTLAICLSLLACGVTGAAGFLLARKKYFKMADEKVDYFMKQQPEHDKKLLALYGINIDDAKRKVKKKQETKQSSIVITPSYVNADEDRLDKEKEYNEMTRDYNGISKEIHKVEHTPNLPEDDIILINEDEWDMQTPYAREELIYYSDGVVTNENNEPIEDFADHIGKKSLWESKIKEEEVIYIRNNKRKTLYMITFFHFSFEQPDK